MMQEQKNITVYPKRVQWVDMAKGYGILCIMLGHMGIGKIESIL